MDEHTTTELPVVVEPEPNQGEGNRVAAAAYDADARRFVADGGVPGAAADARTFVDDDPIGAARAERAAKRGPRKHGPLDALVSFVDKIIHAIKK